MERIVKILQVGRMSYGCGLQLQKILALKHQDQSSCNNCDTLVFVEHNPVYTVGIRTKDYPDSVEEKLKNLGAEFYRTNRGGLITFHGPGQMVAYPIINLKHFKPSMRWYVSQIEQTIIQLCSKLGIKAETSPHTGVWVDDKKICAIGIHGSRFVTTHGLALNCNTDLNWFSHIVPCGIEGKGVTSLEEVLQKNTTVEDIIPLYLECFSETFECLICNYEVEDADTLLSKVATSYAVEQNTLLNTASVS